MTTINKYRVFCTVENQYFTVWSDVEPDRCPNDGSHSINPILTSIVGRVNSNTVTISEEFIPTQGYFQTSSRVIDIPANSSVVHDTVSFDYRITVFAVIFQTAAVHEGDMLEIEINPEGRVGIITSDVNIGDTIINVSPTVFDHAFIGMFLTLDDGVNNINVGEVIGLDKANNTLTLKTGSSHAFTASMTTPTFVEITLKYVKELHLGPPREYHIGQDKIGGASVPPNFPIRICYHNNTGTAKKLYLQYDYLY